LKPAAAADDADDDDDDDDIFLLAEIEFTVFYFAMLPTS